MTGLGGSIAVDCYTTGCVVKAMRDAAGTWWFCAKFDVCYTAKPGSALLVGLRCGFWRRLARAMAPPLLKEFDAGWRIGSDYQATLNPASAACLTCAVVSGAGSSRSGPPSMLISKKSGAVTVFRMYRSSPCV